MRITILVVAVASMLSDVSNAAVFQRDWKTPGDGLLTYDDVSGREWLDLTETLVADFRLGYDGVVSQLAPGGIFEEFVVANRADIIALGESAGINTNTSDFSENASKTQRLIELLGSSISEPTFNTFAAGFVDELSPSDLDRYVALFSVIRQQPPNNFANLTFHTRTSNPILIGDRLLRFTGVMLFRPVPEPSAFLQMASCLPCFSLLARQQCRYSRIQRIVN